MCFIFQLTSTFKKKMAAEAGEAQRLFGENVAPGGRHGQSHAPNGGC